jgi:hypothetical protein
MRAVKRGLVLLTVIYVLGTGFRLARSSDVYQWDFKKDYYAAKVHAAGLNFYDKPYLRHFAQSPVDQFYGYTPVSIWFFRLFALFPYRTAFVLMLVFKALLLAGLLILWRKHFLGRDLDAWFPLFALLAFNGTLCVDLITGNIALFEMFLLWLALSFFLRRKYWAFGGLIAAVSLFKVAPLAFLALLLTITGRRKWSVLFASAGMFLLVQGVSYAVNPLLTGEFLKIFRGLAKDNRPISNPSTWVFLDVASGWIGRATGWTPPRGLVLAAFLLAAGGILYAAVRLFRRLQERPGPAADRIRIYFFCLTYAVLTPRLKDYQYTLLIVPAWFAVKRLAARRASGMLFLLAVLTIPGNANPFGLQPILEAFWGFYPLVLAYLFWGLYAADVPAWLESREPPDRRPGLSPGSTGPASAAAR